VLEVLELRLEGARQGRLEKISILTLMPWRSEAALNGETVRSDSRWSSSVMFLT
jgi:hypothetical protein